MRKNKLLLLLALLLTAATGAWAQTETLLLTIENKDYTTFTSGSKTFDDKVTVTFSKTVYNEGDTYGWYAATESLLTVAGTNGYNITSCKFYTNDGTANTGYTIAGESPSVYLFGGGVYTDANQSEYLGDPGITKIEVYTAATGYTVSMKDGVKDAGKWTVKVGDGEAQALPIGGLKGDGSETVTLQYNGRLKVKGVKATSEAGAPAANIVDLSTLTADYEAQDGDVLTGETSSYEVTIAAGATVTLDGVTISRSSYCIKCAGDATIILKDGSTNTLTSTSDEYPALSIGDANTTLTIQGSTGVLNVTSGPNCAGIGGGYMNANNTCGNIRIEGGVITAQGGQSAAGIGADCGLATCGDIIITGGTITAKGGSNAAGIGTGSGYSNQVVCGDITIANTVTKVTATKGENAAQSIGKGRGGKATCGTVTIGGTKYWENNAAVNGGDTYLATSPLIYDPTAQAKPAATVTTAPTGAAIVGVGKTTALVSGGVADGGTLMYAVTTTNTKPASTDGFSDAVPTAETITASGKVYVWYYVKGDDTHSDSEIAATAIEVTVMAVPITVTWNPSDIVPKSLSDKSFTKDGITFTAATCDFQVLSFRGGGTFTTTLGNFTKIEISADFAGNVSGTGWTNDGWQSATWTGNAASVSFSGDIWGGGMTCEGGNLKIVFTIE